MKAFANNAASLGPVKTFIDTAGAFPSQASPEQIIKLDLIGTAYALDIFGEVMASGGAGVIIFSKTEYTPHYLTAEDENALALTPTDKFSELLCLGIVSASCSNYKRAGVSRRVFCYGP